VKRLPLIKIASACPFLACLAIFWAPAVAIANNPGGWTPLVTASVTTGTEAFGSKTDRFLDNGILHVLVATNGNVDSIKYLQPGLGGTPKVNGIEMVSQFGMTNTDFGNHYNIYYYWYPDGSQDSANIGTTTSSTNIDLGYKRTYMPGVHLVPVDMEIHYLLGQGNTVLYVYLVANHPSSYSSYSNMTISFIQMIWPVAHDSTNFLCENMYIDHVKTGLSLNGRQLDRAGIEPNFIDTRFAVNVPGLPAEVLRMTSGPFSNQMTGKYSYNVDYAKLGSWGRASDTNKIGEWVVVGSPEYISNGPTVRDYVNGFGLMYMMPVGGHYDDTGITVKSNANWTKIFGPWALYFNSPSNGATGWQDSQNQALAEQQAWPYAWLTNSAIYQPKSQRASATGKLIIYDALRPGAGAAGAWIGLAAPDTGLENATNNWQFQSDGYQYWVRANADGTFIIPNIQTFSPYGGPATYQLYAYSDGTNQMTGEIGEFSTGPFTFASGATTNLGTLTWNVPHRGGQMVWEIGIPDRTAAEFRHGDEFAKPALWWGFTNEFSNPLEYNVADNNWSNALNYCHSVDNIPSPPWKWHINFNLPAVRPGTYWLNIAYATAASIQVIRVNNDGSIFTTLTPTNGNPGASTYYRQGIHAKYTVAHVAIPSGNLRAGTNTITLDHEVHSNHAYANFMYDYLDLEGPAVATPKINFYSTGNNRLIVRGTNGTIGATYFALTSTNLTLPLAQWTPVYTNIFDAGGHFAVTNAYVPGTPQKYFILQVP